MKCPKFLQLCPNHDNYPAALNLVIDEWTIQADTIHAITEQESILNMAIERLCTTQVIRYNPSIDCHLQDVDLRD
jgi:hypothetical protein